MNEHFLIVTVFIAFLLVVLFVNLFYNTRSFAKAKEVLQNENILKGVVLSVVFLGTTAFLIALFARPAVALETSYFNYVQLDAGVVYTKNPSPQCEPDSAYDRATSDIRLTMNAVRIETSDGRLQVEGNGEALHHSGAFCEDGRSFDSLGGKLVLRWNF